MSIEVINSAGWREICDILTDLSGIKIGWIKNMCRRNKV